METKIQKLFIYGYCQIIFVTDVAFKNLYIINMFKKNKYKHNL